MKTCHDFKRDITFLLSEQWRVCLNTDVYTSALQQDSSSVMQGTPVGFRIGFCVFCFTYQAV